MVGSKEFIKSYDERYRKGYMEGWPIEKKNRVKKYLMSLNFPPQGVALDFGCGKGDFTNVLKSALPKWEVYGSDISQVALDIARENVHSCHFISPEEIAGSGKKFDLVFSHHVIEHVPELESIFGDFDKMVADRGHMIHILPARCEDTFEHWVATSANDGIDKKLGNRYYYEHPGHLRRLSASEFSSYCLPHGFNLIRSDFSNKIFGTINWISRTNVSFVRKMFATSRVNSAIKKLLFLALQLLFMMVVLLRLSAVELPQAFRKRHRSKSKYLKFLIFLSLFPVSVVLDKAITVFAEVEWMIYRRSGSEMYLLFER